MLWSSGRTNDRGVILGASGKPLPSEFFERDALGKQQYQEHHDVKHPVTSQDEAEHIELKGTAFAGWKLQIAKAER